jgi:hypothetical protein
MALSMTEHQGSAELPRIPFPRTPVNNPGDQHLVVWLFNIAHEDDQYASWQIICP